MSRLLSAFSTRESCNRRCFWGRMLWVSLGFSFLLNLYMLCLFALNSGAEEAFFALALLLCSAFTVPSGLLFLLLYRSMLGYACPPHFPEPTAAHSCLLLAGMVHAALGMLALTSYAFSLAIRRLRTAGLSPAALAMGLIPLGGPLFLSALLTFPDKKEAAAPAGARAGEEQGRIARRSFALRSLPAALTFVLSFAAGMLFLENVGELYRNHVWIVLFLSLFCLSIPALVAHPLAVLGLVGYLLVPPSSVGKSLSLACGQGLWDAALAALILLILPLSSLRLFALSARRLRDAGRDPHNLAALFVPFLPAAMLGSMFAEAETPFLLLALSALWFILQNSLLWRRSKEYHD